MTATLDLPQDLIDRVGALSDAQRGRLFALFPADVGLKAELTERWERYEDGTDPSYTAEEVMAELRAQAAGRSQ